MSALHLALPASALLVLGLCWSVSATQPETTVSPGFVTSYITPMANLSVDKLVGRWYVAEHTAFQDPPNITEPLCLVLDFLYDDNGTLVVDPITQFRGVRATPKYMFPVSENGVWDSMYRAGEISSSQAVVDLSDNRFLAVASCKSGSTKNCGALVTVRHIEDAGRQEELAELRRRLAQAGVDTGRGLVSAIDGCRASATPPPNTNAEDGTGPSTPDTQ